jgi:formate hydrogenlyase subunit 3/multisubunit Na+/H+ antiporter MnhD subunit
MLTPAQAVLGSLAACLAGAVVTLLTARHRTLAGWLAFLATAVSSALALYAAGAALVAGGAQPQEFLRVPALGFALKIHVDGLTAIFIGLIASIALPAAFYSIEYMKHYRDYGVARYYPYFLLFLAAMYGLVSTTDMMWFFFIFWQMMTLPGYALIRFEHRKPENIRAANRYLLMMQIACALTMIGAELLVLNSAPTGADTLRYDFDVVSHNLPALLQTKPALVATAFALFLVGFGIKLGMWPFGQVWLPDAHPAAPSPVSAMLSGVMIKTGVYGIMRYFLWLVPTEAQSDYPMAAWGAVIAGLGTITLFTGTMQALKQEQTKRLLAFHSIGQVGYILLGIGACLAILPASDWALVSLATVGFYGALFHTVNHGTFKSLLFLNSGSILWATGTQDLNKLGSLMRFMPLTAVTALIASFSISGVPLFNGFASKWTIFVAAVQGGAVAKFLPVCAVMAVLTSALTLASFIKFFGTSFLSRTSALVAEKARQGPLEVGWMMRLPQVVLAAICVVVGVMPAVVFKLMDLALNASQQGLGAMLANTAPVTGGTMAGIAGWQGGSVFAPIATAAVLGLMFLLALGLARLTHAQRRQAAPWLCGYMREADHHRYVAHNFYAEIKRWFRWLGGAPKAHPQTPAKKGA